MDDSAGGDFFKGGKTAQHRDQGKKPSGCPSAASPGTRGLAAPGALVGDGRCAASRQDTDVLFHFIVSELIPVTHFPPQSSGADCHYQGKGGVAAATSRRPCCVPPPAWGTLSG